MSKELLQQLLLTDNHWTGLVLRVTLGLVLFPHAVQKLFGWFNGPGISGEIAFMTKKAGLPLIIAYTAICIECLAMLLLLAGFCTKLAALMLFIQFIGIIAVVHFKNGFFMNWFGKLPAGNEGFEFHILVLGLCIGIMLEGGGRYSFDRWMMGLASIPG